VIAAILAAAGVLVLAAPAQAAPPANDDFADAQAISLPSTTSGTLTEATIESPDEPNHAGFLQAQSSVWYSWTPISAAPVKLSTCAGSSTGPVPGIAVYHGDTLASLTKDASDLNCIVKLHAAAGAHYKIAVFSLNASAGAFQLQFSQLSPPANDDFANAETVPSSLPQNINGTTVDATGEPSETPHVSQGPNASVWYSWTPAADVTAKLEFCDQLMNEPAELSVVVYTGTAIDSLTRVTDNQLSCRLYFHAEAGQEYRIVVDTTHILVEEGPFQAVLRQLAPPANDDLANAQPLPAGQIQNVAGTTVDATVESGEPNHFGPGCGPCPPAIGPQSSVWYEWTSDASGGATTVDACSGIFLFSVAVYTGDAYPVAAAAPNDGSCSETFTAAPSTTYRIAVASHNEDDFTLNPVSTPPGGNPSPVPTPPGPTGKRAKALKKCKKKRGKAHKKCVKRAKRLPV
jgi:hypothetical protein